MDFSYPDKGENWLPIIQHNGSDIQCDFATPYIPSPAAASNGVKKQWVYGAGIKFGVWWTGILGGNPTFFKYKEQQK